jgi:hypothetical protein
MYLFFLFTYVFVFKIYLMTLALFSIELVGDCTEDMREMLWMVGMVIFMTPLFMSAVIFSSNTCETADSICI